MYIRTYFSQWWMLSRRPTNDDGLVGPRSSNVDIKTLCTSESHKCFGSRRNENAMHFPVCLTILCIRRAASFFVESSARLRVVSLSIHFCLISGGEMHPGQRVHGIERGLRATVDRNPPLITRRGKRKRNRGRRKTRPVNAWNREQTRQLDEPRERDCANY